MLYTLSSYLCYTFCIDRLESKYIMDNIIDEKNIRSIELLGFKNKEDKEIYSNVFNQVVNNVCDFLCIKDVSYDYSKLNEQINKLKIICRNDDSPEWDRNTNTIFVAQYNQLGERINDEDEVINFIHEIIHFVRDCNIENNNIFKKYISFEELFIEYLTYNIVRRTGGISLENYYIKNRAGYCRKDDFNFMNLLVSKINYDYLVNVFFKDDVDELENLIGINVLNSIQKYFLYYIKLYDMSNIPSKKLNELLDQGSYPYNIHMEALQQNLVMINTNIENMTSYKKVY